MKTKKTTEEGWGCVPQLKRACVEIDELHHFTYEIKNCVRVSDLKEMIVDMKYLLERAVEELDEVDTNVEWITVEEHDV